MVCFHCAEPYTEYQVWVRALVNGRESPNSEVILARTDVDEPSAPTITNLTCYGTGVLFVEWLRPVRFHKTVDFYRIYYKQGVEPLFQTITIQSSEAESTQRVNIFSTNAQPAYPSEGGGSFPLVAWARGRRTEGEMAA